MSGRQDHVARPAQAGGRALARWAYRPFVVCAGAATSAVLVVTLVPGPAAVARPLEVPASPAVAVAPGAQPDGQAPDGELVAEDEIGAVVQARATGRRVEVLALRSSTSRTWVEPDGLRRTEEAAGPVRFVDDAGAWQDIDLNLKVDAAGAVVPGAHPLGLVLPGGDGVDAPAAADVGVEVGGEAPSGTVQVQELAPVTELSGEAVTLGWPGELPEPVLDGPVATYRNVTAGVDLQMQATSVGYETFMVIAERPAPGGVLSWTLPLALEGAEAVARPDGSVEFVSTGAVEGGTPAGEVVSVLPSAHAWDAQVDEAADVPTNLADVAMTVTTTADGTPAVLVTPDAAWLQDPSTVFPVTVDPSYASETVGTTADTYVQSDTGTAVHGGKTELRLGTYNGGTAVARSFLAFDSAVMAGKNVQDARLTLYATHTYSCSARNWEAWAAGSFNESGTVWSNQPPLYGRHGVSSETKGNTGCDNTYVGIGITSLVRAWAAEPVGAKVLGLKAENEADTYAWKKFASRESGATAPRVVFTYNRPPAMPGLPSVDGVVGYTPPGGTAAELYTANRTPTLSSAATDPDGDNVSYRIQVHSSTAGTAASLVTQCVTPVVASGTSGSCTVPTLPDNANYYARSSSMDSFNASPGWSGYTTFSVASGAPPTPTVSCPGYTNGFWSTTVPTADVTCTISVPNSGATTAGHVHFRIDGGASTVRAITPPPAGTTAKVQVTLPRTPGQHTIRTRSESRAGVQSEATDYAVGWGTTVAMSSPRPADSAATVSDGVVVTTDTVAVSAAGPLGASAGGAAPTAKVQWRTAGSPTGSTVWNEVPSTLSVSQASAGYTVTGKVSTAAMTSDAGTVLNARVPVRLEVRVCLVYGSTATTTTTNCATSPGIVKRVPHAFGSGYPVAEAGPGQVALWTGEWSTSATDVSVPGYTGDLSVSRTHATYANGGSSADPVTGVFGPGWTANFDGAEAGVAGDDLVDNSTADGTLVLFDVAADPLVWLAPPATAGGPSGGRRAGTALAAGTWLPADEDTEASGAILKVVAPGSPTTKASVTVTLEDGTITTFESIGTLTASSAQFSPAAVKEPGVANATSFVRDGTGRVTSILAPAPPGVDCGSTWTATRGCRGLVVTYAPTTTATLTSTGDIAGQVKEVAAVLWDPARPGGAGMRILPVAQYTYGQSKRLSSVTDPRTGHTTAYGYDGGSPRLAQVTPPGLAAVDIVYATGAESRTGGAEARFARVTRKRPAGDSTGGTAVLAAAVYGVPLTGAGAAAAGLPDMPQRTIVWGQAKPPTHGTAIFGPDTPGTFTTATDSLDATQWSFADLNYTDSEGRVVNSAQFGAGDWQVSANEYDEKGNVTRALDSRATATVTRLAQEAGITSNRTLADQLATLNFFDADGILLTDSLGPARDAVLADGSTAYTRRWTHVDYDEGAPDITDIVDLASTTVNEKTLNPATGNPWRRVTRVTAIAVAGSTASRSEPGVVAGIADPATRSGPDVLSRTITQYGNMKAFWAQGLTSTSIGDVDASGGPSAGDVIGQMTYDGEGRITSRAQPGAIPGPESTDSGTFLTRYYSAGPQSADPACAERPEWAGLVCTTGPGSSSPLPTTRMATYSTWLQPETVRETTGAGSQARELRTTRNAFDAAGRLRGTYSASSVAGTAPSRGRDIRYRPNDGLVSEEVETQPGALESTSDKDRRTTTTFDSWGRTISRTDDDGLTTTTTYDATGFIESINVPVGGGAAGVVTHHLTTYTHDGTDSLGRFERRGLLTRVESTGVAAQAGAYDEAGDLVHEVLPGQIIRSRSYDTAGGPTQLTYSGPGADGESTPWLGWRQVSDIDGRARAEWTPDTTGTSTVVDSQSPNPLAGQAVGYARVFSYDRAERLTNVLDQTWPNAETVDVENPLRGSNAGGACTIRSYTFDARGRRQSTTARTADSCASAESAAARTQSATYDAADRQIQAQNQNGAGVLTGSYSYDELGRQTQIPAIDSPAFAAGDYSAEAILISYDATDAARSISQIVRAPSGLSSDGTPLTAQVQETTTFSLDSSGRRQAETVTTLPVGQEDTTARVLSTMSRHYSDETDSPAWTYTATPATQTEPETRERAFSVDGIGGYTATVTSDVTGDLRAAMLNIQNLHGDVTTTIPLAVAPENTAPGGGSAATTISAWRHTDEYGNSMPTGAGAARPTGRFARSGTTAGAAYGWLGGHQRALTAAGLVLMGARLYNPVVGGFTSADPITGGNTTEYTYPQDPIGQLDLDGCAKCSDLLKAIDELAKNLSRRYDELKANANKLDIKGIQTHVNNYNGKQNTLWDKISAYKKANCHKSYAKVPSSAYKWGNVKPAAPKGYVICTGGKVVKAPSGGIGRVGGAGAVRVGGGVNNMKK